MSGNNKDFNEIESKIEELESKVDENEFKIDNLEDRVEDIDFDIENIKFSQDDFEIYLLPSTISKYIENLIKLQKINGFEFYPKSEANIIQYFKPNFKNFDYNHIKFKETSDLNLVSKIISYQGRSGTSFIENIDNIIDINKPLMLFFGIEQLSAFFSNLHFNFTWENTDFNKVRSDFTKHGIDSYEFKNKVDINNPIEDILNKKIKLEKAGLAQRFFMSIPSDFLIYFDNRLEISLVELLKLFYLFSPIPNRIKKKFEELYGSFKTLPKNILKLYQNHRERLLMFLIYLITFILCHLCRYKLYAWSKLLKSDEGNIGYFIKFFIKFSKVYFIKEIFDYLFKNEKDIKAHLSFLTI